MGKKRPTLKQIRVVLEEAQELDDINEIKNRIAKAIEMIWEAQNNKRVVDTSVLNKIPYGKVLEVMQIFQPKRRGKAPTKLTTAAILIAEHGGEANAIELANAMNLYAPLVRKLSEHPAFEYDADKDVLRLKKEYLDEVKKILEG